MRLFPEQDKVPDPRSGSSVGRDFLLPFESFVSELFGKEPRVVLNFRIDRDSVVGKLSAIPRPPVDEMPPDHLHMEPPAPRTDRDEPGFSARPVACGVRAKLELR